MFGLLLVLHIFAAVAVMGSAFLVPIIRRPAQTAWTAKAMNYPPKSG